MAIPINHFDREKLFYPLVMSYIFQLLGIKELAVRGFVGPRNVTEADLRNSHQDWDWDRMSETLRGMKKLLGPLELRSEYQMNRITVDADEIASELRDNFNYLLPYYYRSAGSLLVLAHEMANDRDYRDNGPLWEFLRHCRNAATHNGLFHFKRGEPRRPAVWGQFILDPGFQGIPLFKGEKDSPGLFSPGDPIRLLWDIEQAYPKMKA